MFQSLILKELVQNEEYARKAIPHLEQSYFEGFESQIVFSEISFFITKYNELPTKESLLVSLSESEKINPVRNNEAILQNISQIIESSFNTSKDENNRQNRQNLEWLLDNTEKWCQDRAIHNSVIEAVNIIEGKNKDEKSKHSIPKLLQDALAVSFNKNIGHDYLKEAESRFDFYRMKEDRLPFDIDILNKITGGGIPKKTVNILGGTTNSGKTLIMCHFAAMYLMQSKNVLYITMEMAEERIAERIDANLLNIQISDLGSITKNIFTDRLQSVKEKTNGRLFIKEYPTGGAHAGHFRALLDELKTKQNFVPDVLIVDYMNICSSSKIKSLGGSINSYAYVKAIIEELRGLSIEYNLATWSPTQTNRSGHGNSDADMTNISESFATAMTADFMLLAISTEELQQRSQLLFKQLKSRYGDPSLNSKFFLGVDKQKMRIYELEDGSNDDDSKTDQLPNNQSNNQSNSIQSFQPKINKDNTKDFDGLLDSPSFKSEIDYSRFKF